MAIGDVTLTKVGVFYDTTIAAGITGQNLPGTVYLSGARFIYLPIGNGQTLVLKEVVSGW